jgi:4,5-dihydroxyphthalate decarboxylase
LAPGGLAADHREMGGLRLSFAVGDYDHVRDVFSGDARAEGIELLHLKLPVEEIFFRTLAWREFDVAELSLAKFAALVSAGDRRLAGIPAFPSRVFRHSAIYVRRDGRVKAPGDLAGRRVGIPEWAQTAGVWVRGFLAEDHGIDLAGIHWVQAGLAEAGRREKVRLDLPRGIAVTPAPDKTLDAMLLAGEIDAAITARPPPSFAAGDPRVGRLFADWREVEADHFARTGIFPIMHLVTVRSALLERDPWIAGTLLAALTRAKDRSLARAADVTASRFPLPFLTHHPAIAEGDCWPYGIAPNRPTLEAFLRYASAQGIVRPGLAVADLFFPNTAEQVRV